MPRNLPNMTATEVNDAEKAYFKAFAEKQSAKDDPLMPVFERMLEIIKEHDFPSDE